MSHVDGRRLKINAESDSKFCWIRRCHVSQLHCDFIEIYFSPPPASTAHRTKRLDCGISQQVSKNERNSESCAVIFWGPFLLAMIPTTVAGGLASGFSMIELLR